MVSHITTPISKLRNADIGTVVFVVEGAVDEYKILEQIFVNVFGYSRSGRRERNPDFLELRLEKNTSNRIIIIRAKSNNIKDTGDFEDYFDKTYAEMFLNKGIEIRYSPVYYVWDRDPGNNTEEAMNEAIDTMYTSRNEENYMNGLLLLSYPCVEAYVTTCYEDLESFPSGTTPKQYVGGRNYLQQKFDQKKVINGINTMLNCIAELGISDELFNLGNLSSFNREIYDKEEVLKKEVGQYRLLSLISIMLIDLGFIV